MTTINAINVNAGGVITINMFCDALNNAIAGASSVAESSARGGAPGVLRPLLQFEWQRVVRLLAGAGSILYPI